MTDEGEGERRQEEEGRYLCGIGREIRGELRINRIRRWD
jgi:hypothetical protein